MVLLLAPLAAVPPERALRGGVVDVLEQTTVDDAHAPCTRRSDLPAPAASAAKAAPEEDVASTPTRTLRDDVMALAAGRDDVGRQYANGYAEVFDVGLDRLTAALRAGHPLETAIVDAHLSLLAARPDTLIARKRGRAVAAEATRRAGDVLTAGLARPSRRNRPLRRVRRLAPRRRPRPQSWRDGRPRHGRLVRRSARWDNRTPHTSLGMNAPEASRRAPVRRYKVRVSKDYLVFCSGHFITYAGDQCERIHGHNYRVAVEVEDDLDENHYVFDFIALKDLTRAITDELDHRMLVPKESRPSDFPTRRPELAGPLPGPILELPPRRVRPRADREHDRRATRLVHRRPPAAGDPRQRADPSPTQPSRGRRGELRPAWPRVERDSPRDSLSRARRSDSRSFARRARFAERNRRCAR